MSSTSANNTTGPSSYSTAARHVNHHDHITIGIQLLLDIAKMFQASYLTHIIPFYEEYLIEVNYRNYQQLLQQYETDLPMLQPFLQINRSLWSELRTTYNDNTNSVSNNNNNLFLGKLEYVNLNYRWLSGSWAHQPEK
jgi:hypothetical protein